MSGTQSHPIPFVSSEVETPRATYLDFARYERVWVEKGGK